MELSARFFNEAREEFDVRVTVRVAQEFCHKHGVPLGEFLPDKLDAGQLLELAWLGTRHQARVAALAAQGKRETFEMFLDGLEGPSCTEAQVAAVKALLNFTVRTLPRERQATATERLTAAAARIEEGLHGAGPTSGVSAEPPASPPPAN